MGKDLLLAAFRASSSSHSWRQAGKKRDFFPFSFPRQIFFPRKNSCLARFNRFTTKSLKWNSRKKRSLTQKLPSNIIHSVAIRRHLPLQELQQEVSSLLEFKNALLETFPHLQGKLQHQSSSSRLSSRGGSGSSASTLRGEDVEPPQQPQQQQLQHVRQRPTALQRSDSVSDESWAKMGATAASSSGNAVKKVANANMNR